MVLTFTELYIEFCVCALEAIKHQELLCSSASTWVLSLGREDPLEKG